MRLVPFLILFSLTSTIAAAALPIGASYPDGDGFAHAPEQLERMWRAGFRQVSFIPGHAFVGLDAIDFSRSADPARLEEAIRLALVRGFTVVVKPHLEPGMYRGIDPASTANHSWRVSCPWRGFFDLDPLAPAYADGVVARTLEVIGRALVRARRARRHLPPVRFELGTELMNSEVEKPERWVGLLARARRDLARLGLIGQVLLSHDFCHHIMLPEDEVLRMPPSRRRVLGRYVAGLDAVSISQYMDLTVAAHSRTGMPTPEEIADALERHERTLVAIFQRELGLAPGEIPPLHIGEFGIGSGGLAHPNLWDGHPEGEAARQLEREIEQGFRGLVVSLSRPRLARSAVLWTTGRYFDIFGWFDPANAVPGAARVVTGALR